MEKLPNEILEAILDYVGLDISSVLLACRLLRDAGSAHIWRRVTIALHGPVLTNRSGKRYKGEGIYNAAEISARHVTDLKVLIDYLPGREKKWESECRMLVETVSTVIKSAHRLGRVHVVVFDDLLLQDVGEKVLGALNALGEAATIQFSHILDIPFGGGGYTIGAIERTAALVSSLKNASYTVSPQIYSSSVDYDSEVVRELGTVATMVRDLGFVSRNNCPFLLSGIVSQMTSLETLRITSGAIHGDHSYKLDLSPSVELLRLLAESSIRRPSQANRSHVAITGDGVRRLFIDGVLIPFYMLNAPSLSELTMRIESPLEESLQLPVFTGLEKLTVFSTSSEYLVPISKYFSLVSKQLLLNVDCPNLLADDTPESSLAVLPEILHNCQAQNVTLVLPYFPPDEMRGFWRELRLPHTDKVYLIHTRCRDSCGFLNSPGYASGHSECCYEVDLTQFA
ncbi:hypothetical protein TRVA0_008S02124 [Trichomonascus vanleenenianus]|uniref:uncharacterized protein n=1 Tax=Trichomonascus vanleenenianus TaxID=2268995 RepID=UPI003ECADB80